MSQFVQAFVLGSAAILTNVCMLPLYPGTIAFLSSSAQGPKARRISIWLGFAVLAGILSMMVAIGLFLYLISRSFSAILFFVLPVVYGVVILFGVMMLFGYNPFARMTTVQAPVVSNPFGTAYLYGLLFGPMTLPCTGPMMTTAFALSFDSGDFSAPTLLSQLAYILVFGLGFGWPLLLLPMLARPLQQRFTKWTTGHHRAMNFFSGTLLIFIGLFGLWTEVVSNLS